MLEVRRRCANILVEAMAQVNQRLPASKEVFGKLKLLSPRAVLSQIDPALFHELPMLRHWQCDCRENLQRRRNSEDQRLKSPHVRDVGDNDEDPNNPAFKEQMVLRISAVARYARMISCRTNVSFWGLKYMFIVTCSKSLPFRATGRICPFSFQVCLFHC